MRKTRADSILLSQPEGVQAAICRLETEEGLSLEAIRARLSAPLDKGGFEIEASVGTISEFLTRRRTAAFRDRLQARASVAAGIEDAITPEDRARIDQGILDGLREMIFDSISAGQVNAKDAKALVGLILKSQQQSLDARKVAILEAKAAAADAALSTAEDDTLTPEERLAKIREGLRV